MAALESLKDLGYSLELHWLSCHSSMWDLRFLTVCASIWGEDPCFVFPARSWRNREGFGYSALGYLVISQWLLVYNLAGKLQLVPTLFILKIKINRLSMEMLGFLTLDCSFNGRFDLLSAYGLPNASASSSTGKPGLNHGIPPYWLWWMDALQWLLGSMQTYWL